MEDHEMTVEDGSAGGQAAPEPRVRHWEREVPAGTLEERLVEVLRTLFDPEIPVNIYDLGLIYDLEVDEDGLVTVTMTLTSPMCPVAETLPVDVERYTSSIEGVSGVKVDIVWEPSWTPEMMAPEARAVLNIP